MERKFGKTVKAWKVSRSFDDCHSTPRQRGPGPDCGTRKKTRWRKTQAPSSQFSFFFHKLFVSHLSIQTTNSLITCYLPASLFSQSLSLFTASLLSFPLRFCFSHFLLPVPRPPSFRPNGGNVDGEMSLDKILSLSARLHCSFSPPPPCSLRTSLPRIVFLDEEPSCSTLHHLIWPSPAPPKTPLSCSSEDPLSCTSEDPLSCSPSQRLFSTAHKNHKRQRGKQTSYSTLVLQPLQQPQGAADFQTG